MFFSHVEPRNSVSCLARDGGHGDYGAGLHHYQRKPGQKGPVSISFNDFPLFLFLHAAINFPYW